MSIKIATFIFSGAMVLYLSLMGSGTPGQPFSHQYCNRQFFYCLDYPSSLFPSTYFSPNEDSVFLKTADGLGEVSVISTKTVVKLDSYLAFEQRLRVLSAPGGQPNILSIINGDDYYEVSFLYDAHWYYQRAGFFQNYEVLFTIQVPVNRPELMVRMKEDVGIEF